MGEHLVTTPRLCGQSDRALWALLHFFWTVCRPFGCARTRLGPFSPNASQTRKKHSLDLLLRCRHAAPNPKSSYCAAQ